MQAHHHPATTHVGHSSGRRSSRSGRSTYLPVFATTVFPTQTSSHAQQTSYATSGRPSTWVTRKTFRPKEDQSGNKKQRGGWVRGKPKNSNSFLDEIYSMFFGCDTKRSGSTPAKSHSKQSRTTGSQDNSQIPSSRIASGRSYIPSTAALRPLSRTYTSYPYTAPHLPVTSDGTRLPRNSHEEPTRHGTKTKSTTNTSDPSGYTHRHNTAQTNYEESNKPSHYSTSVCGSRRQKTASKQTTGLSSDDDSSDTSSTSTSTITGPPQDRTHTDTISQQAERRGRRDSAEQSNVTSTSRKPRERSHVRERPCDLSSRTSRSRLQASDTSSHQDSSQNRERSPLPDLHNHSQNPFTQSTTVQHDSSSTIHPYFIHSSSQPTQQTDHTHRSGLNTAVTTAGKDPYYLPLPHSERLDNLLEIVNNQLEKGYRRALSKFVSKNSHITTQRTGISIMTTIKSELSRMIEEEKSKQMESMKTAYSKYMLHHPKNEFHVHEIKTAMSYNADGKVVPWTRITGLTRSKRRGGEPSESWIELPWNGRPGNRAYKPWHETDGTRTLRRKNESTRSEVSHQRHETARSQ